MCDLRMIVCVELSVGRCCFASHVLHVEVPGVAQVWPLSFGIESSFHAPQQSFRSSHACMCFGTDSIAI